jgi:hypothetical protein
MTDLEMMVLFLLLLSYSVLRMRHVEEKDTSGETVPALVEVSIRLVSLVSAAVVIVLIILSKL